MSNVQYIVANYLKVLGAHQSQIDEMISFLENGPHFPSLRSITDCFDEWQYNCTAARTSTEKIKELAIDGFFIAHLQEQEGAFVLVLRSNSDRITYLNSVGEIIQEEYDSFTSKWSGVIFIADTDYNTGKKLHHADDSPSLILANLKNVAFNQEEPVTFKLFRRVSIYFSYLFIKLRLSPNAISTLWFLSLTIASLLFAFSDKNHFYTLIAAILICFYFILDCSDGEVARLTKRTFKIGSHYEQIIHWTTNLLLIIGATMGVFRQVHDISPLFIGFFCLLSDSCFHFLYIQLNYWINQSIDYGWFHKLAKVIYVPMPININIFLLGAIFNRLLLSLLCWGCISSILFLLLAIAFFGKEFKIMKNLKQGDT